MPGGFLSGLTAIESASGVAGAFCGKLLADMGARVVKVEAPGPGDPARHSGPFPDDIPHPEKSGLFLYLNTNKSSVTLDVESAEGRELLRRLATEADVLIEERLPGVAAARSLTFDSLTSDNPRLVVCSITPFGQTGPYRDYRAYHLNVFHAGGEGITMGAAETPPVRVGGRVAEYDSGAAAAVAVVAALYARLFTGQGQHIDLSRQEACAALGRVDNPRSANGESPLTRSSPRFMVGGLLPCSNGYVYLNITHEHMWQGLLDTMDNPAWSQEEWCRDEAARALNAARINSLIAEWTRDRAKEDVYHQAQAHGVPLGPIVGPAELLACPQLQHRQFFVEIDHPVGGRWVYPGTPYRTGPDSHPEHRPAPTLGADNGEVFGALGLSPADQARLREEGVI